MGWILIAHRRCGEVPRGGDRFLIGVAQSEFTSLFQASRESITSLSPNTQTWVWLTLTPFSSRKPTVWETTPRRRRSSRTGLGLTLRPAHRTRFISRCRVLLRCSFSHLHHSFFPFHGPSSRCILAPIISRSAVIHLTMDFVTRALAWVITKCLSIRTLPNWILMIHETDRFVLQFSNPGLAQPNSSTP